MERIKQTAIKLQPNISARQREDKSSPTALTSSDLTRSTKTFDDPRVVDLVIAADGGGRQPEESELDRLRAAFAADIRLRVLGKIIQEYYQAMQYDSLNLQDLLNRAIAWKTPTAIIPVEEIYNCYARAVGNFKGEKPLSAFDLVSAWRSIWQEREDGLDKSRLLTANAVGCCERCYGRGYEIVVDRNGNRGSRKCDHRPYTDEERAEYFEGVELVSRMREKMRRTSEENARIEELKKKEERREKPQGVDLICSSCARSVNTLGGWQIGEKCNFPGESGENSRDVVLCYGVMQTAPKPENNNRSVASAGMCRHVFLKQRQQNPDNSVYIFNACTRCGETRDLDPDEKAEGDEENGAVIFAANAFVKNSNEIKSELEN